MYEIAEEVIVIVYAIPYFTLTMAENLYRLQRSE